MYSAEVLSQLRSLNHHSEEMRRVPGASPEALLLQKQIDALRARLPHSILTYHDRLAARGKASAAKVRGESCSACHLKLPRGLFCELSVPGRFGVCPNCGVFLWVETAVASPAVEPLSEPASEPVSEPPAKAPRRKAAKVTT